MANRYNSENYAWEFRDLQATTFSIDKNGKFALLAGRKYLAVLSLDAPPNEQLVVRVPYGGKYEISNTQWCKGDETSNSVAVASSQRCDIFELTDSELKCSIRLKGHTRVITDLDWCSLQPTLLATSSFDSFVHIWDIRQRNSSSADKPQFSLSALDGASQVRWNRHSEDILASCDGGHVKIWDLRKPGNPSEFIAAHASKINGLEWANSDINCVITAAQDCTVKFSKLSADNPTKAKGPILSLTAPVWRARAAPFGRGVVTQCVPILRRDSGLLSLWDWKRFASPIFTFQAYDIIEFAWRKKQNFDLLTWSRDQTLRIWTLPQEIVQLCGGEDGGNVHSQMNLSNDEGSLETEAGIELTEDDESPPSSPKTSSTPITRHKRISTSRSRKSSSPSPLNRRDLIKAEVSKVELEKPDNVNFDQIELDKGLLRFSWVAKSTEFKGRGVTAGILASFPNGYPSAPPTFICTNASSEVDKNHVVKCLRNVAQQLSKKNEQCLSKCIQQFSELMKSVKTLEDDNFFPTRGVSNVPFPRTSGARFCAVGMLVCFGRPSYLKRVSKSNCDAGTPRSLSALGPYLSQVALENEDNRHRRNRRHEKKRAGLVTVFDVSPLLPFSRGLAEDYKHIVSNPSLRKAACDENSVAASAQKKYYISHVWQACSIISSFAHPKKDKVSRDTHVTALHMDTSDSFDEEEGDWLAYHPLGCELLHSMITHFAKYGDVQTAGTVAGIYTSEVLPQSVTSSELQQYKSLQGNKGGQMHRQTVPRLTVPKWWTKGVGSPLSPYHTVHGSDTLHHGVMISPITAETFFRQHRSNSWSDSLDDIKTLQIHSQEIGNDVLHGYHNQSYQGNSSNIQPPHHFSSRGYGNYHPMKSENSVVTGGMFNPISEANGVLAIVTISKSFIPVSKGVLLDCNLNRFYDRYKKLYSELLFRWGLLQQRAEILKNLTEISRNTVNRGVDFLVHCQTCGHSSGGPYCNNCKRIASICSICHIPTKGLCTICAACGHGGHVNHVLEWFKRRTTCPSGCGCKCIIENTRFFQQ